MKKKLLFLTVFIIVLLLSTSTALADKPAQTDANGNEIAWSQSNSTCAKIQDGTITDSAGNPLSMGFDQWGYNYQAHIFNGYYDNYSRPTVPVTSGDMLVMKWSDEWLANVDCNGDGKLDRGLVNGAVGGTSLGWETNHNEGWYDSDGDGIMDAHYTYFVKIVWTGPGSPLWGQYTTIEEVYNDPVGGFNGLSTKVGAPGFGLNDQWTTIP
jgi:hypothetical protein